MNDKHIPAIAVSLLIGLLAGYLIGNSGNSPTTSEHSHTANEQTMTPHSHSSTTYDVSAEQAPSVSFTVEEDTKSGWNITLNTTDFRFSPDNVGGVNVVGEGHAHLYVDDVKVARLYGPYFHYDENFDGTKTFRVTLNANDHSEYSVDGEVIEASQQVTHEAHS